MQNMIISSKELMHVGGSVLQGGFCEIIRPALLGRTILISPPYNISSRTSILNTFRIPSDQVLFLPLLIYSLLYCYHSYLLHGFLSSEKVRFLRAGTWSFCFLHIFLSIFWNCLLTSASITLVHATVSTLPPVDSWSLCIHPRPHPTPPHLTKSPQSSQTDLVATQI